MGYDHKKCEDEQDATRMAENILRKLGYVDVHKGRNILDANEDLGATTLLDIARNAERIARWARAEQKGK